VEQPELEYNVGEQELLAGVDALREWRCYLEGQTFDFVTDHNPLVWLQTHPSLSRKQAGWMEYLQRFHIQWTYRPGRRNVADPVIRAPSLRAAPCDAEFSQGLPICNAIIAASAMHARATQKRQLVPEEGDLRRKTRRGVIGVRADQPVAAPPPHESDSDSSDAEEADAEQ